MNAPDTRAVWAAGNSLAVLIGGLATAAMGAVVLALVDMGPLSTTMAMHTGLMNVAAPITAVALRGHGPAARAGSTTAALWLTTVAQLAALWTSHGPIVHQAAHAHSVLLALLHTGLFVLALNFWLCIVDAVAARWQAMLALLLTGKLACLLGALLVFAPRLLFEPSALTPGVPIHPIGHATTLADQQLAGLLMIAACPLSYVLTAVVLAAQTMTRSEMSRPAAISSPHVVGR